MWIADGWKDYQVIDCSQGEKLERWGRYVLLRPDPQVIWDTPKTHRGWKKMNGHYHRSKKGGGEWEYRKKFPAEWNIGYDSMTFKVTPTGFKHTGIFPEQATNWDEYAKMIAKEGRELNILNLFGYTGGATLACAAAGAKVCHVDAAKGMVERAGENVRLSNVGEGKVRYIIDDCKKFVEREIRRGRTYDAIIMDPPSYGRGPNGEMWKLENELYSFVSLCANVLSDNPLFVLINSYTTGLQPQVPRILRCKC